MDLHPLTLDLKSVPVINMEQKYETSLINLCKAGAVPLVLAVFHHLYQSWI